MRRLCLALLISWLLPAAAIAAADPNILATVTPVPTAVTLQRAAGPDGVALNTLAAYRVTFNNGATNTLNRVFFAATARNVGSSEALVIDSTVPSLPCTGLGTASVSCSLGSLAPGASIAPFFVVVRAPRTGQRIDLAWTAGGDEGKGGGNGCCNQVGTASTLLVDPTTDTSYLRQVTSFVKPVGGTFFTGLEAVSTSADGWTTLVKVPAFTTVTQTTASVVETPILNSCAPYALSGGCFETDLTIPGTFASLEITFRWDKDFFNLGSTKPADVKLFYTATGAPSSIQLALCSADAVAYGSAPSSGRPCLAEAPKKLGKADSANKALWGDLQFRVLALDNGKYAN